MFRSVWMRVGKLPVSKLRVLACLGFLLLFPTVGAQTLTLANDSQSYATLTNTTVTMTGRSELRITGATTPLSGCTINLNSTDAWFYMTAIKPSVVSSTYLSQIKVNGAAAVLNTNCRIVQYGDGTVVIPQASTFTPMQVFTGSRFTGSSMSLACYTAYSDSSLGSYANNISSFKLKRGYTATVAQNADGTGVSRNYVAQDGDIEVSVLPDALNDSISFIRIFPWRWVNKKGIAGAIAPGLNVGWYYNWNIDQSSSLDLEYVPIRAQRYWPSLAQDWKARGANSLLGYNEPDSTSQANIAVGDAIWSWPDLLNTGLRVGSPAPTDGGVAWLESFVNQADAADLRVDYVAVHYYRSYSSASDPDGATNQLYNFLKDVYNRTKRPIWLTEFNNGANWTTGPDPTAAQQAATVGKMMDMLESTPFVERYALYNWVEDVRRVKWDDGSLTAAGVVYRDHASTLSYSQMIPEVPTSPAAWYRFENNASDSSAYGHAAMLKGEAAYATGKNGQGVKLSGNAAGADHVLLSPRLGDSTDFTFGAWVYWNGGSAWQRIFDLGNGTDSYMFLTPSGGGNMRFAIKSNGGAEQQLNTGVLAANTWTHVAVTISGNTGKLFVNGVLVATNTGMTINPVDLGTTTNFLGKSQFAADPCFGGILDDVQFLPYALSDAKVAAMETNTAPVFTNAAITGNAGTQNVAYSGTLAGTATDADSGDTITYSKIEGPDWLVVAANGTLSGTPTYDYGGPQQFIVLATDGAGATACAVLNITLPAVNGDGTWSSDSDGLWSDVTKWSGSFPANSTGYTANFSTLNIAADRTVTLDASRTIGNLSFGDTSGAQSWTLAASSGKTLTLDAASGTPAITVSQNAATILAPLAGTLGLNKLGSGTLVLGGSSTLSGPLAIDTNAGINGGVVRLAHPTAASAMTSILIRNNNAGYSTLELDGIRGPVSTAATLALSGRAGAVPAIRNVSGDNTLSGTLTINSGGGNYIFQSDAGTLNFGAFTSAATGARALTFQGAGNFAVNGVLSDGSATTGVSIVKTGAGMLTLSGMNTNTGATSLSGGSITLVNGGNLGSAAITTSAGTALNINRNITLSNTLAGPVAITNTGSCTITGDFSGFSGSYTHNSATVSTSFNSATATSRNASYTLASPQGSIQGFITGGAGDYILEMGSLNGVANSLVRGGLSVSGTTTLKIGNLNTADVFAGSITNGTTKIIALNKVGSGTLTLSGASSYTGATTITSGTLAVDGSLGNTGVVVASSATLSGAGSIAGAVTTQSGGMLSPGGTGGIGTLTLSGGLTLQAGATTRLEINRAASTADKLAITGGFTRAGTLVVANLGGPFVAGDSYVLFTAGSFAGSFASTTLPTLPAGLQWNTSNLPNGVLSAEFAPGTYGAWASGYSLASANGPVADPDSDGSTNALEWLAGSDPLVSGTSSVVSSTRFAAQLGLPGTQTYLTLQARVRKVRVGATLSPRGAATLEALSSIASTSNVASAGPAVSDGDFEILTWYYTTAIEDASKTGFMRLVITVDAATSP
ncbi:autotransporter-associated beta strand repeat-containing protein [Luteolibacter ambystomatis]|uniref:Autotransporter-associated beta strand repeat-containing protein n=1 Tax=Luteolibacter ambystomatis TaxID=2824561 RepID=A0A975G910_9BACT|nr:glycosyl hydrolase [Luteolibacter ambystomatis]QUE51309.1 autotransporter-associated beta strand repeat-containing protein [Luteolibacter ambystomatis]